MPGNQPKVSAGGSIVLLLVLLTAVALENAVVIDTRWYKLLLVTLPLLLGYVLVNRKQKE